MPILRPNLVWLQDCDIAQFGLVAQRVEGALGTGGQSWPTGQVLGSSGLVVLSRDATTDVRQVVLTVTHVGDSVASMLAALRSLQEWCAMGPVQIRTAHDPALLFLGAHRTHALSPRRRQFRAWNFSGTITFDLRNPYAWERVPQRYIATGGTRVAIPSGSGPTQVALWLTDVASSTQITLRDPVGNILRQSTLTIAQATADALLFDTPSRQLTTYVAGVAADAPGSTLTLGHGFFTLDPRVAQRGDGQWCTLESSSGQLWADVRRSWIL